MTHFRAQSSKQTKIKREGNRQTKIKHEDNKHTKITHEGRKINTWYQRRKKKRPSSGQLQQRQNSYTQAKQTDKHCKENYKQRTAQHAVRRKDSRTMSSMPKKKKSSK